MDEDRRGDKDELAATTQRLSLILGHGADEDDDHDGHANGGGDGEEQEVNRLDEEAQGSEQRTRRKAQASATMASETGINRSKLPKHNDDPSTRRKLRVDKMDEEPAPSGLPCCNSMTTTYFGRIACWHLLGTLALASIHIVLNLYLLVKLDGSTYFADTAPFCLSVLSSVVIICLMGVCVYKRAEVTAYRFARDTEAMVSFRKICFTVLLPLPLFVFSPYVAFQIGSSWTYAHSLSNLRIKESVPVSTTSSFVTAGYEAFTFTDGFMLPQIITQKNYGQRIFSVIPVFDNNCIGVHTPAHASYDTAIESVRDCPVQFWFAGFRTLHASGDGPYDVATLKAFPRHGVVISDHLRNLPQSADVNASVIYKATAAQAVVDHKLKAQADAPVLINFDARVDAAAFRDDFSLYIGVAVLMVAVDITLLCARLIVEATCPKHAC